MSSNTSSSNKNDTNNGVSLPNHIQYQIIEYWFDNACWITNVRSNDQDYPHIYQRRVEVSLVSKTWFRKISTLVSADVQLSRIKRRLPTRKQIFGILKKYNSPFCLCKSLSTITYWSSSGNIYDTGNLLCYKATNNNNDNQMEEKKVITDAQLSQLYSTLSYIHLDIGCMSDNLLKTSFSSLHTLKQMALDNMNLDYSSSSCNNSYDNGSLPMFKKLEELDLACYVKRESKRYTAERYINLFKILTPAITNSLERFSIVVTDETLSPDVLQLFDLFRTNFTSLKHLDLRVSVHQKPVLPALFDSLPLSLNSLHIRDSSWDEVKLYVPFAKLLRLRNLSKIGIDGVDVKEFEEYLMDEQCTIQHVKSHLRMKTKQMVDFIRVNNRLKTLNIKVHQKESHGKAINSLQPLIQFNTKIVETLTVRLESNIGNPVQNIVSQIPLIENLTNLDISYSISFENIIFVMMTPYLASPDCKLRVMKLSSRYSSTDTEDESHTTVEEELNYIESFMVKNRSLIDVNPGIFFEEEDTMEKVFGALNGCINRMSPNIEVLTLLMDCNLRDGELFKSIMDTHNENQNRTSNLYCDEYSSSVITICKVNCD